MALCRGRAGGPWWLLGVVSSACAAAPPNPAHVAPGAPAAAPRTSEARVTVLPPLQPPQVVSRGTDGSYDVIAGGVRARVSPGGVALAARDSAADIVDSIEVSGGVLLRTFDQLLAFSPGGFLGTIEARGTVCGAGIAAAPSRGVALAIDASGGLRVAGPDHEAHVVATPGALPVISARFLDERRGVALLDGGAAVFTADGGQSWAALDLGGAAAGRLEAAGDVTRVRTASGAFTVDGAGRVAPMTNPAGSAAGSDAPSQLPPTLSRAFWTAVRARYHAPVHDGLNETGIAPPHRDGSVHVAEGTSVLWLDADGGEIARYESVLPDPNCSLDRWGDHDAMTCPAEDGLQLYRVEGGHATRVEMEYPYPPRSEVVQPFARLGPQFSDDGLHMVRRGPCQGEPAPPPPTGAVDLCVLEDGAHATHSVRFADVLALEPTGMHEDLLAARVAVGTPEAWTWEPALLNVNVGSRAAIELEQPEGAPAVTLAYAQFATDGTLYALGHVEGDEYDMVLAVGRPGAKLVPHRLPRMAHLAAMADARNGVAAGDTLRAVWITRDGGASWSPALAPNGSDAHSLDGPSRAYEGTVVCSAVGCTVGPQWTLHGFGRLAGPTDLPFGVAPPAMQCPPASSPFQPTTRVECDESGAVRPAPALPRPSGAGERGAVVWDLAGPGLSARLSERREQDARVRVRAGWLTADGARARAEGVLAGESGAGDEARYALRGGSRVGLLLERCAGEAAGVCPLWWLSSRGGLVRLPDEPAMLEAAGWNVGAEYEEELTFLGLPDGGGWILRASEGEGVIVDVASRLAPDGRVTARREFAWSKIAPRVNALGRDGANPVLLVSAPGQQDALRSVPLGEGAAREISLADEPMRACRAPAAPDALVFADARDGEFAEVIATYAPEAGPARIDLRDGYRAWIEVPGHGAPACLRRVDRLAGPAQSHADAAQQFVFAVASAAGDALDGTVNDAHRARVLRCTVRPSPTAGAP